MYDIQILQQTAKNQCPNIHKKRTSSLILATKTVLDGSYLTLTKTKIEEKITKLIDTCPDQQASSLIGVAPITRESGRLKGKRIIQGGRAQVRTVLYMAMMSAIQCNPIFKVTYERLLAAGKPKKVAIVA